MLFENEYIRAGTYYFNSNIAESIRDMNYLMYRSNDDVPRGNEIGLEAKVEPYIVKDQFVIFKVTVAKKENK